MRAQNPLWPVAGVPGHFVTACFLITEGSRRSQSDNLRQRRAVWCADLESARSTWRRAVPVAEMHATGFAHGPLFWRNILIASARTDCPSSSFSTPAARRWPGAWPALDG